MDALDGASAEPALHLKNRRAMQCYGGMQVNGFNFSW